MNTVVALGKKAQAAVDVSGFGGTVLKGSHPSMQNINRNFDAMGSSPKERGEERVEKYAKRILASKDK
jgi:hypothetical protein